jgi:hypothetical protein
VIEQLLQLIDRVAELERKIERIARWGTVDSVDMDAGKVRVALRGHEDPTPPVRWAALSTAVWAPPTEGEQCLLVAPGGTDKIGAMVAICGIATGAGKGDKYVIGAGTTSLVAHAQKVIDALTTLKNAISGAGTTPGDGGAAFKAALLSALASWPGAESTVAASKTEAE